MAESLVMQDYDKLMGDGYAKGVPGDSFVMRMRYRTPASIGKHAVINGLCDKTCIGHYNNTGAKPIKNYMLFCESAIKNYKPKQERPYIIPPLEAQVQDLPIVIEMESVEEETL